MNNIEKFEKIMELSRLKGEYHKREILSLVTLENSKDQSSNNMLDWISVGKSGFDLFQQVKSLIQ